MKNHVKSAFILSFLFVFFIGCKSEKNKTVDNYKVQTKDTADVHKDQYRIALIFTGNKSQMLDLIKGPVSFDIMHTGNGKFKVTLMKTDGNTVAVLADVIGDFKGKKKLEILETNAYILNVETEGQWSVYRE